MTNQLIFAGMDFSSGRQPVTFAALDETLRIVVLERYEAPHVIAHLKQYGKLALAVNIPSSNSQRGLYSDVKKKLAQTSAKAAPRQFIETDAQACFRALIGKSPLPRRTLEGRIQRGLLLFDQGLRLTDPMDFFEEITRHRMLEGVFPNELLYSASELDALTAAYVAWLAMNEPEQLETTPQKFLILKTPERDNE